MRGAVSACQSSINPFHHKEVTSSSHFYLMTCGGNARAMPCRHDLLTKNTLMKRIVLPFYINIRVPTPQKSKQLIV